MLVLNAVLGYFTCNIVLIFNMPKLNLPPFSYKNYPVFTCVFFLIFLCLEINLIFKIKYLHTLKDIHFLVYRQRLLVNFAFCEIYGIIFSIVLIITFIKAIIRNQW